ncbi:hypothetical protein ADK55_11705 [Streptomyces sp. WM4235]|nr:hypothetical protein ADK55_11705 [Streptomyces sp. WM4235]
MPGREGAYGCGGHGHGQGDVQRVPQGALASRERRAQEPRDGTGGQGGPEEQGRTGAVREEGSARAADVILEPALRDASPTPDSGAEVRVPSG